MRRVLKWSGGLLLLLLIVPLCLHRTRDIQADIWIDRPPVIVWQIIAATNEYPVWNPFIRHMGGNLRTGSSLAVEIAPPGSSPMTFRPVVLVAQPYRLLRWRGSFGIRGLFDGEHSFRLESDGTRTHFVQSERFSGLLVNGLSDGLLDKTQLGFAAMNRALKQRAESR